MTRNITDRLAMEKHITTIVQKLCSGHKVDYRVDLLRTGETRLVLEYRTPDGSRYFSIAIQEMQA